VQKFLLCTTVNVIFRNRCPDDSLKSSLVDIGLVAFFFVVALLGIELAPFLSSCN
jgi:hypothetical protein